MNWLKVAEACEREFHNAHGFEENKRYHPYGPEWWGKFATVLLIVSGIIRAGL